MKKSTMKIGFNGAKVWTNSQGNYHNEEGPAIIFSNGENFWYINGERHREDGPAIITSNNQQHFYVKFEEII